MAIITSEWYAAQKQVRNWLSSGYGVRTSLASYGAPFDLFTSNGTRIEVKFSPLLERRDPRARNGKKYIWFFNIHRHGKVSEQKVDFYILMCQPTAKTAAIGLETPVYLVVPAPLEKFTISISLRQLLTQWGKYSNAVQPLVAFDESLTPADRDVTYEQSVGTEAKRERPAVRLGVLVRKGE
jgi:hypothetical protein